MCATEWRSLAHNLLALLRIGTETPAVHVTADLLLSVTNGNGHCGRSGRSAARVFTL